MNNKLAFISDVLISVSKKIPKAKLSESSYSYKKGYLADADLIANSFICSEIKNFLPDSIIFSEEDSSNNYQDTDELVWIIDPICGTTNYIRGFPFFVHALSIWNKGDVVFSGIFDSSRDEMFLGSEYETTLNGKIVNVSNITRLDEAILAINCNQSDWSNKKINLGIITKAFEPPVVRRLRIIESANLEMAYVACGRLDAYLNPHDKIWDIAAGSLMIKSAGGRIKLIKELQGSLVAEYLGVIATNSFLMDPLNNAAMILL